MQPHNQLPKTHSIRCLEHDHHFSDLDLYDEYTGDPLPNQMEAKCTRCGVTMRQSLQNMSAEINQLIEGKLN